MNSQAKELIEKAAALIGSAAALAGHITGYTGENTKEVVAVKVKHIVSYIQKTITILEHILRTDNYIWEDIKNKALFINNCLRKHTIRRLIDPLLRYIEERDQNNEEPNDINSLESVEDLDYYTFAIANNYILKLIQQKETLTKVADWLNKDYPTGVLEEFLYNLYNKGIGWQTQNNLGLFSC